MAKPLARLYIGKNVFTEGSLVELDKSHYNYLNNVLRLKEGSNILVFNNASGEWLASIASLNKQNSALLLEKQTQAPSPLPELHLFFAPIKSGRIDFLIEKATELGVTHFHPILTERTIVRKINATKLNSYALEASEQSERIEIPEISELKKLKESLKDYSFTLLMCDETGSGKNIKHSLPEQRDSAMGVIIGPEGGFTPGELSFVNSLKNVTKVSLGPRVLRADTAAIAAVTCLQALSNGWDTKRHNSPTKD